MPLLEDDPLTQIAFSIYENKGVFALLLGSGLSRAAGIPTGWEITLSLVRRVALARGVPEQADWAAWHQAVAGAAPDYSALLAELASTPAERRAILDGYIEPNQEDRERGAKVPPGAHRAIAHLVADGHLKVIITTNFDRLMENALREAGVEPVVVASPDALAGAQPLAHSACYILKVHGDYKDDRILNTDDELSVYPESYNVLLDRILDEYGLIVCGWSGVWDKALRAAILRAPNRRFTTFWTTRGAVAAQAQDLIAHRRAKTVKIAEADAFFVKLAESVDTLQVTGAQNPSTVDMTVGMAKRYVTKPEHRVLLEDLVAGEITKIIAVMDNESKEIMRPVGPAQLRSAIARYEAASEPLAKIACAIGRWGDGSELGFMSKIMDNLVKRSHFMAAGIQIWAQMRSYPALLLFTGYGLGLTHAERWTDFYKFLTRPVIDRQRGSQKTLVNTLFLKVVSEQDDAIWKLMDGLDAHKFPLSVYIHRLFKSWWFTIDRGTSDYISLHAHYEAVCSIAVYQENEKSEMVEALKRIRSERHSGFKGLWMPRSRLVWNTEAFESIKRELESGDLRNNLVKSGFVHGNASEIDFFLENLKALRAYNEW